MTAARITRAKAVRLVSATLVGAPLAACAGVGQPSAPARTAPTVAVPLEHWNTRAATDPGRGIQAALDDYQAKNPGYVKIETVQVTAGQSMDKLKASMAGGTPPSLFGGETQSQAAELFVLGGVIDLNEALKTSKEWAKFKADAIPNILEGSTWKGKLPFMPMVLAQELLGINKQILLRAGAQLPAAGFSWNDFLDLGKKTATPPDLVLFEFAYTYTDLARWMHANGLFPLSADRTKVVYDTPQVLETLQWVHDQVTRGTARNSDGTFDKGAQGGSVTTSINTNAAFHPARPATAARFPNVDPKGDGAGIHVTHYPFGSSNTKRTVTTFANSRGLVFLKTPDAKKDEASVYVAEWAGRTEVQTLMAEASGQSPVGVTAGKEENLPPNIKNNPILKAINGFGKGAYLTPNFPNWLKATAILQENLGRVFKGELLPKNALADAQQKMQPLIDDDLKRG